MAPRADAALGSAVVSGDLEPGRHAATAFHDENGNAKLDESFPGVPTGPYGFSNDAQGLLGPATFDAAAVTVGEGDEAVRIALIYRGESG